MKNLWCDGRGYIELDGSPLAETKSYVYQERSMKMVDNDMKEELIRRRRAAWSAHGSLKEATDQLQDADLRVHLFDSTVLPARCSAADTWPVTSVTVKSLQAIQSTGKMSFEVHSAIPTPSRCKAGVPSARPCGIHVESQAGMGQSYTEQRRRPLD